jgi:hypothetical protein
MSHTLYTTDEAKDACAAWLEAFAADAMEDHPVIRSACLKLLEGDSGQDADLMPDEQRAIDWMMDTVLGIEFSREFGPNLRPLRQRTWLGRLLDRIRGQD